MNLLRNFESYLAAHLGTATGISCVAASDTGEIPAKPYCVVSASCDGRKGTLYPGTCDARICYMPTQGIDDNGTGNSIFDIGDTVAAALSDSWPALQALNVGTSHVYMTLRFDGSSIEPDGERGRAISIRGIWTARDV